MENETKWIHISQAIKDSIVDQKHLVSHHLHTNKFGFVFRFTIHIWIVQKKHTHTHTKKQNSMYTLNANCAFARILFALTRNRCYSQNARAKQKVRFHLIFNAPKHLAEYSKITHRPALCAATHWIRNCCHSFHSLETVLADNGCDC